MSDRSASAAARCSASRRASSRVVSLRLAARAPNSSRFGTATEPPKLPAATSLRNACAARTGRMKAHEMTKPPTSASTTEATANPPMTTSERRLAAAMLARSAAMRSFSCSTTSPTSASMDR